jgi:hypothetical protein
MTVSALYSYNEKEAHLAKAIQTTMSHYEKRSRLYYAFTVVTAITCDIKISQSNLIYIVQQNMKIISFLLQKQNFTNNSYRRKNTVAIWIQKVDKNIYTSEEKCTNMATERFTYCEALQFMLFT